MKTSTQRLLSSVTPRQAVSPEKLKFVLQQLPEITDSLSNRDLANFTVALAPLKLEIDDPWKRRFAGQQKLSLPSLENMETDYEVRCIFENNLTYQPIDYKILCLNQESRLFHRAPAAFISFTPKGQWLHPIFPDMPTNLSVKVVIQPAAAELELARHAVAEIQKLDPSLGLNAGAFLDHIIFNLELLVPLFKIVSKHFVPKEENLGPKRLPAIFSYEVPVKLINDFADARALIMSVTCRHESSLQSFTEIVKKTWK